MRPLFNRLWVSLYLLLHFIPAEADAQYDPVFKHITVENGLSTSSVLSIAKDSRGMMWFGTKNGLNRYNTINFKIYKSSGASNSLSSGSWIFALLSDSRNRLWIGTDGGLNRYLPESDSFERILSDKTRKNSLSNNHVNCIYEDSQRAIWVGTTNGLNKLTGMNPARFQVFFNDSPTPVKIINTVFEDSKKRLWVGTQKGIIRMEPQKNGYRFKRFDNSKISNTLSDEYITSITEDRKGNIWVGTKNGGLNQFNEYEQIFSPVNYSSDPNSLNIRKIVVDKLDNLWIGTLKGLIIFNPATQKITRFISDPNNRESLSNNSIKDIYMDKDGSVWIGTMYGGINVLYSYSLPFKVKKYTGLSTGISSNIISAIVEDKDKLWIGTDGEGLNQYDPGKGIFLQFKSNPKDHCSLNSNFVKAVYKDKKGRIWVGTLDAGMGLYNPLKKNFRRFVHEPGKANALSSNNISSFFESADGRLFIGTGNEGLNIYDPQKSTFKKVNTTTSCRLSSNIIKCIFEDYNQNLWIGTPNGLNVIRKGFNTATHFFAGNSGLKSDYVYCIVEDSKKRLWFGTKEGGLSLYNPKYNKFSTFTTADGLVSNNVYGILEDNNGHIWLSTDQGVSRFDFQKKTFTTYNVDDGLPGNEFNSGTYKDKSGQLYFGSYNGLIYFNPADIQENKFVPKITFTNLKLFNKPVSINGPDGLLKRDISLTNAITFTSDQNIFTIDFAVLNFLRPNKNRYAYKLLGLEKDWNYVSTSSATYTNLPPGDYTFLARGTNNDGRWTSAPARLTIHVLPPFWKTWWAYLVYLITISGLLYWIIRFFRIRARLERDLYYKVQEGEQQEEFYRMKLDFFTNISHEIRTPLTLILGPLEQLVKSTSDNSVLQSKLAGVKNNADRLLRLVKELLEFRKADAGHLQLNLIPANIVSFCREVFNAFESMASAKGLLYEFLTDVEYLESNFDAEQLEKALFNVISNAFKFTPNGGTITVSVRPIYISEIATVEIKVCDSGKGIPIESLPKIFDNFYQVQDGEHIIGSGIGLSLAKKIIELHGGKIEAISRLQTQDRPGKSCFTILLPCAIKKSNFNILSETSCYPKQDKTFNRHDECDGLNHKYSLLIVEDNLEVSEFLKDVLCENYTIHVAEDGLKGMQLALSKMPDLIVSDVMMPEMNGFEFCQKIKSDERTNHIPVILLTARASEISQLEGLETGADAYIVKPFSVEVLRLHIRNFISLRETFHKKFSEQAFIAPAVNGIVTEDEKFLQKLMAIIEEQLDNSEFDVATLSTEVGMSKNILYKKIYSLTGYTIADFIKFTRLKKAGSLLLERKLSIAEVAFSVGFSDRKYFSQEFRKLYGKAPSEFQKQAKQEESIAL